MYIPRLDNTAVQHWLLWVIGSPVKWDRSYWSMGSHHYKDDMKWWTQALKNQSSPKSLPPLDDAAMDHLQPPGICKPRGSSKPSQSSCAVLGSSVHESQASSDPTIDSCLIHWAMPHQVLPCAGHQDCRSLQSFWHPAPPGLAPWQLCHCSLITHHDSHLSDRRWKFFVKNIFSRKDRLLFSSDMLYLLWHAIVLLFLLLGDVKLLNWAQWYHYVVSIICSDLP